MEKGITASVMAVLAISMIAFSFIYLKPLLSEQKNAPAYTFIESTKLKMQNLRHLADQAISEAMVDRALYEAFDAANGVPPICPATAFLNEFELTAQAKSYLVEINDFPENDRCNVEIQTTALVGSDWSAQLRISCTLDSSAGQTVEIQKTFNIRKRISYITAPGNCFASVTDIDGLSTFTQ